MSRHNYETFSNEERGNYVRPVTTVTGLTVNQSKPEHGVAKMVQAVQCETFLWAILLIILTNVSSSTHDFNKGHKT